MKSNTPAFWCPLRDFALAIVCLAATLSLRAADEAKKVLCTTAIDLGTRSVIFQRVEPPKEAVPVAAVQAAAISTRTAAETAALAARARLVERVVLDLSCTVHETGVTELRWWHEGAEFRVLSSVDFLQLRGLGGFEAEGRSYTLFLGIGTAMSAGTKARLTAQGVRLPASVLAPAPVLPADVMQDIARNGGSRYVVISAPEKADAVLTVRSDNMRSRLPAKILTNPLATSFTIDACWRASRSKRLFTRANSSTADASSFSR